jgi:hypothetical protein
VYLFQTEELSFCRNSKVWVYTICAREKKMYMRSAGANPQNPLNPDPPTRAGFLLTIAYFLALTQMSVSALRN